MYRQFSPRGRVLCKTYGNVCHTHLGTYTKDKLGAILGLGHDVFETLWHREKVRSARDWYNNDDNNNTIIVKTKRRTLTGCTVSGKKSTEMTYSIFVLEY